MTSRKKTIGIAFLATGGAKATGALVQLAVLPIAAHALGASALGLLFTIAAMASFPLIAMAGFSPAASLLMAKASASDDAELSGRYFWTLILLATTAAIVMTGLSYLLLRSFNLPGASDAVLLCLMLLFLALNFIASPIDGARAAARESHFGSAFAIAGSILTLAMALTASSGQKSAAYFFAAIYLAPVVVQLLNLLVYMVQHRATLGAPRINRQAVGEVSHLLFANMQAQSGMVLYLHGSIFLLSQALGTASVAVLGAFVRVGALVHSMLMAFFAPVFPTLTEAALKGDDRWLRRGLGHLLLISAATLLGQAFVTAVAGDWIARHFLDLAGNEEMGLFAALAAFIFCYSATHLMFLTLLSTASGPRKGAKILIGAVAGFCIGQLFFRENVPLYLATQAICMAIVALGVYARDLFRVVPAAHQNKGD